jgi:hypothetical protein
VLEYRLMRGSSGGGKRVPVDGRRVGIVAHRVTERFAERGAAVGPELNAGMLAVARALPPPSGSSTTWAGNVDFSPERSVVPSDGDNALNCAHEVVAR